MKKTASVLLTLMLLFSFAFEGCQAGWVTLAIDSDKLDTYQQTTLNDFDAYLRLETDFCEKILWVLDAIDAYCSDPTWDNLIRARAASTACSSYFEDIKVPEATASDSEMDLSLTDPVDEGIIIEDCLESLSQTLDGLWGLCYNEYSRLLFYTAPSQEGLRVLSDRNEIQRALLEYDLQFCALAANYFFLTGDGSVDGKALWEGVKVDYPLLAPYMDTWYESQDELDVVITDVLDKTDEKQKLLADSNGEFNALENRTIEELTLLSFEDRPSLLPLPDIAYYDTLFLSYEYNREDDTLDVQAGDDLSTVPNSLNLIWNFPSEEALSAYLDQLISEEFEIALQTGDPSVDTSWLRGYFFHSSLFLLSREGAHLLVWTNPTNADLVPSYYFDAINAK